MANIHRSRTDSDSVIIPYKVMNKGSDSVIIPYKVMNKGSDSVIIPCKVMNPKFTTLYGIITGPLSTKFWRARYRNV